MALTTGFNPDEVQQSLNGVSNSYRDLMTAMCVQMKNKFIDGMSSKWACKEAQNTFQLIKEAMDDTVVKVNTTFQSVFDAVKAAGDSWAASTGTDFTVNAKQVIPYTFNVDCILENINGVRGVDKEQALQCANSALKEISNSIDSALNAAVSSVNNCGFLGDGQSEALRNSLSTISNSITRLYSDISSSITVAVSNTVSKYGDTAGKISAAFTVEG